MYQTVLLLFIKVSISKTDNFYSWKGSLQLSNNSIYDFFGTAYKINALLCA